MDSYEPTKSGLAQLTASLLDESTENYSAEELQEELRKIGSSINVFANDSRTTLTISSLKKNIDRTLEIAEEILYRPKFDEADFDRLKKQQLEGVKSTLKDPSAIANQVFRRLLYGDEHIFSVPASGIEETVESITLEDVKAFYNKYYSPDLSELVVVGDISKEEVLPKLNFLTTWNSKSVSIPDLPDAKPSDQTKIYLVDKAAAPQSEIRIGYITDFTYDVTGDYFKSYLMNYPLGGAFNSRINLNLREDKGWTYGARAFFNSSDDPGPYTARAGVLAAATDSAVYEFMKEISDYREKGITDEEITFMRNSIGQRDARSYETPNQKANFLRRIVHYNLDKSYVDEQTKIIQSITKDEINSLAKKYLQHNNMYILVVGDEASNRPKLERLGYEIIKLNEKGDVIDETKIDTKK